MRARLDLNTRRRELLRAGLKAVTSESFERVLSPSMAVLRWAIVLIHFHLAVLLHPLQPFLTETLPCFAREAALSECLDLIAWHSHIDDRVDYLDEAFGSDVRFAL
jgi:hypothetical protein